MLTLKAPSSANVMMKGARGLVGEANALRPGIFETVPGIVFAFYTPLKAGEDTTVPVPVDDLPANADVKSITARLDVVDEDSTGPAPPPNAVTITRGNESTTLQVTPSVPTRPRNVTVRLEQGEPFWTFSETLVKGSYDLPDFAPQLNAYLDKVSTPGNRVTLNFVVRSDTPGRVKIVITGRNVTRLQTQTWTNELDQTVRMDRNLELGFGDRVGLELDPIGGGARPTAVRLDLAGAFGPERLLGPVTRHSGADYATVSPDYAVAQRFALETDLQAAGISGLFAADAGADVYVELQADERGVPGAAAPLARSNLTVGGANADAAPGWGYAQFETPAQLRAGTPYWIVVKGVSGKVRLGIEEPAASYLGPLMVNRTGRLWKPFGSPAQPAFVSLLRVVYVPGVDNQSAAVLAAIEGAAVQGIDPGQSPTTVALPARGAAGGPTVITVASHARGTLTIANVIQEY